MACGTSQVYQPTVCQQNDTVTVREIIAVYLWLDIDTFDTRIMFQCIYLDFIVKMADVANNGLIFHLFHVIDTDDIDITGSSDKDVTFFAGVFHGYYFKTFHGSLQCTDRIDLCNQHPGSVGTHRM